MSERIPEPWLTAAERKGVGTYRPLAAAAKLSHETARKVVLGLKTSDDSIRKVADALGIDVEQAYAWRDEQAPDYSRDFIPDERAPYLTHEEREAINKLIRLLTEGRGGEHDLRSAPMNAAADEGSRLRTRSRTPRRRLTEASRRPADGPEGSGQP